MNSPDLPNPGSPPLKLPHRDGVEASQPTGMSVTQMELAADFEALREREKNLREYEERLRAWQAQLDARSPVTGAVPGSNTPFLQPATQLPFSSDSLLASSWEKFHRARALLESEQKQMRDERMMMREAELNMKRREAAMSAREEDLANREKLLTAPTQDKPAAKKGPSAIERLTKAPFFGTRSPINPDK
jgi:hypothetical protein